jgi:hypothetical protein
MELLMDPNGLEVSLIAMVGLHWLWHMGTKEQDNF